MIDKNNKNFHMYNIFHFLFLMIYYPSRYFFYVFVHDDEKLKQKKGDK